MGTIQTTLMPFESIAGDVDTGGWECSANFINAQGLADYSRRVEAFWLPEGGGVWDEDWLTGMRGFILPRQIEFDRGKSRTDVTVATSHVFLENAGLQGIFFASVPAPSNPHQDVSWTLGEIIKHIVEEHTNIAGWVDTSGIETVDSTSINYFTVHETSNLWQTLKAIGQNEFYVPYFTKDDRLIYDVHPMFAPALPEPVIEIDNRYIVGQPVIQYRDVIRPDQVRLLGLTDDAEVLEKNYPDTIGTDGRRHPIIQIRCNSQSRMNELAQRLYLFLQRQWEVRLTLAGPWGLKAELYDRVEVTYNGTAINGVGLQWNEKKFWIRRIEVMRIHNFGAVTELTLDEENYTDGYFYTDYT